MLVNVFCFFFWVRNISSTKETFMYLQIHFKAPVFRVFVLNWRVKVCSRTFKSFTFFASFPACCTVLTELSLDDTSAHHIVQVKEKPPINHNREYERVKMKIFPDFLQHLQYIHTFAYFFFFVGKWGLHHRKVNLTKQLWTNGQIFAGIWHHKYIKLHHNTHDVELGKLGNNA